MTYRFLVLFFIIFQNFEIKAQDPVWLTCPFQVNDIPRSIYGDTITDVLFIGGNFSKVNGLNCYSVFNYDKNGVHIMGTPNVIPDLPLDFINYKGDIIVSGFNGVSKWSNGVWDTLISKIGVYSSLFIDGNNLLIGGSFDNVKGFSNRGIVSYDGNNYSQFNNIKKVINRGADVEIIRYKNEIVAGGNIDTTGVSEILSWDGSKWNYFNGGVPGVGLEWINEMVVFQGDLYVGGVFRKSSGAVADHIMKWDGTSWSELGKGLVGESVETMVVYDDQLWVGGYFSNAGDFGVKHLAIWDGTKWCRPYGEFSGPVFAMEVFRDTLYVGGAFNNLEGDPLKSKIVRYDPSKEINCDPSVGVVNHNPDEVEIGLFPNPSNDVIYIINSGKKKFSNYKIYDAYGNQVMTGIFEDERIFIECLQNGFYVLNLYGTDCAHSLRFFVFR